MSDCPKCKYHFHPEEHFNIYSVTDFRGSHSFSVDMAKQIIALRPRPLLLIDDKQTLLGMLLVNQAPDSFEPQHIDHIDLSVPGIIAFDERDDGGFYFLDGTHRAARCLRDDLPFYVYALSPIETAFVRCEVVEREKGRDLWDSGSSHAKMKTS